MSYKGSFNKHFELKGKHALLSPSTPSWLNFNEEQILKRLQSQWASTVGTVVHEWAEGRIRHRLKVNKFQKNDLLFYLLQKNVPDYAFDLDFLFDNVSNYINDAIGFRMEPEVILYYSENCFGTADAICFRNNVLRIHDLKTGTSKVHIEQLLIYAAYFCLEYKVKPAEIQIELQIYQNSDIIYYKPSVAEMVEIIDKIIATDKALYELKR